MQVFFCDGCSKRVTEGELADGDGIRIGTAVFCRHCCAQPQVREYLDSNNIDARREPEPSQPSLPHAVTRRTPYRGHRRVRPGTPHRARSTPRPVKPKTPVPRRGTPRPTRPASPLPSRPVTGEPEEEGGTYARGTPHRLEMIASRRRSSQLAVYALVGTLTGFLAVMAASVFAGSHNGSSSGEDGLKVLRVRWTQPEAPTPDGAVFVGELAVKHPAGGLYLVFRDEGAWTVAVNGTTVHDGEARRLVRVPVGRAAERLEPGLNTVRATRRMDKDRPARVRPPQLLLVE